VEKKEWVKMMKAYYQKAATIFSDYRHYVPSYAPAALTFYLIILIVPAISIVAFATSLFHFNSNMLVNLLEQYLTSSYAIMLVDIIKNPTISLGSFVVFALSLYAISRGVGNVYQISKELFPDAKNDEDTIIGYYAYTFEITIVLLLFAIGFVFFIAIGPIAAFFDVFYDYLLLRQILLFSLFILFFSLIYKLIPKPHIFLNEAIKGAVVTTLGDIILYFIIRYYFKNVSFSNVYGPLASIVMVFFVLNWGCEIFYVGMYVTHLFYEKRLAHSISIIKVDAINHLGQGVAKLAGKKTLLKNVLPHEIVQVAIKKERAHDIDALAMKIIVPSAMRTTPVCLQADLCDDCCFQYMASSAQLTHKKETLATLIKRFTTFKDYHLSFMPSDQQLHYLKDVQYDLYDYKGTVYFGELTKESITFKSQCLLNDEMINATLHYLEEVMNACHVSTYDDPTQKGIKGVRIKQVEEGCLVFIESGRGDLNEELVEKLKANKQILGLYKCQVMRVGRYIKLGSPVHIYGRHHYHLTSQNITYRLSYQSNFTFNRNLSKTLYELVEKDNHVLALYCGNGMMEYGLSNEVSCIFDEDYEFEDALRNKKNLNLINMHLYRGPVEQRASQLLSRNHYDSVIVHLENHQFSSILSQSFYHSDIKRVIVISDDVYGFLKSFHSYDTMRMQTCYKLTYAEGFDKAHYTSEIGGLFVFVRK